MRSKLQSSSAIWKGAGLLALGLAWMAAVDRAAVGSSPSRPVVPAPAVRDSLAPIPEAAALARERAATGMTLGTIEIPRLRLTAPLVEGVDDRALKKGVGHAPATAFPGEDDNVGLAGHRDTWLRKMARIQVGDSIEVRTPDGRFAYRVDSTFIVTPQRADLLDPTGHAMLTIVTCYPFRWKGHAPKRFIVRASPIAASVHEPLATWRRDHPWE